MAKLVVALLPRDRRPGRRRYDRHTKRAQPKQDISQRPLKEELASELSIGNITA